MENNRLECWYVCLSIVKMGIWHCCLPEAEVQKWILPDQELFLHGSVFIHNPDRLHVPFVS